MDKFTKCLRFVSCSTVKERKEEARLETGSGHLDSDLHLDGVLDSELHLDGVLDELNSNLAKLSLIPEDDQMVEKIQSCKSGLNFLRMFAWSMLQDTNPEISHILMPVNRACKDLCGRHEIETWILDLQDRLQNCKQKFQQSRVELLLGYSLRCIPLKESSTVDLLAVILQNLKDLYKFKTGDEILLLNYQIETLERKITLLHDFFNLTPVEWRDSKEVLNVVVQWIDFEEIQAFKVVVHVFAQYSASLLLLYWVKSIDEDMATQLNLLFINNVLQNYRPCVSVFKAVYIRFLKEIKLGRLDSLRLGQILQIFLDLLLENLVDILKDGFLNFQQSLMFLISFLAQPPDEHEQDEDWMTITAEIEVLVREDLYLVKEKVDINHNFSEANTYLSDLKRNVEQLKDRILQGYDRMRDSFSYDFPKVNGLGFFDFLLQNLSILKEKLKTDTNFIPFAKHLIIQIEEELMSLRPYLDDLFERKKKDEELKDAWLNVIDLAYQSEYAINSCMVTVHPLWHNMARLMKVLDKLKDYNSNFNKIEGRKTHDGATLHCSEVAPNRVPKGPSASSFNEVMVGLEEEADKIVGNLISGSRNLDIVAIVGMPGIGKTTMANKVYNASAVRNHFHVFAYCIVSQVYGTRRILLDILGDIRGKDDNMYDKTTEDLADDLRKSLLGKRYLIIMDDIWDIKSWNGIKISLPNNQNGSRVIFTTRNRDVALLAKEDCILHQLPFLSHKESWELLQKKAFQAEEDCPPDFLEVAKMIANKCKGLPLTIGLIAGLLRTERNLSWWNKISNAVSSYGLTEDCTSLLELSYDHLPEHLKPCFLYFGAFVEDKLIRVNKLTLLWIAEGFVLNSKRESLKNVGKDYLSDLVDRSLVIVDKRSSYGGIKSCRIHDLVHEFCQKKAKEENFFELMVNTKAFNSSTSTLRNPYRVCTHMKEKYVGDATKIYPSIRTLVFKSMWEFRHLPNHRCDLSNLKLVQVMDLEELDCDKYFMREMDSLVHLRFMSISFSQWSRTHGFTKFFLDDVISSHWNLEILILSGVHHGLLPEAFWNMIRLRHVHVDTRDLSIFLGVKKHEAHPHPQLVNLESFSTVLVSSTKGLKLLLQRAPSLRKLSLRCTPNSSSIHFPKVDSLSKLESLNVTDAREACLRSFNLLSCLRKLSLTKCYLGWRDISVISEMPCLEVLKLLDDSFVGPKWDMEEDTEFPKLKYLKLVGLGLSEWIAYRESFPRLEELNVGRCHSLKTIPPCFGEMPTLTRIEVHGSSKSVADSVVEIQEVQKDFGNEELQVLIH